jgi:hypothetical protein
MSVIFLWRERFGDTKTYTQGRQENEERQNLE